MYLAYVDESGDDGPRGSRSYVLGCVMVDAAQWTATFDRLIAFRRFVRARFGVPVRGELKASYLLRNGGPLRTRPLSERARHDVYRAHMRIQPKLGLTTFAVVIDKQEAIRKFGAGRASSDVAWEYLLQRLERRTHYERTEVLVVHDEGDALTVRKRPEGPTRRDGRTATSAPAR